MFQVITALLSLFSKSLSVVRFFLLLFFIAIVFYCVPAFLTFSSFLS